MSAAVPGEALLSMVRVLARRQQLGDFHLPLDLGHLPQPLTKLPGGPLLARRLAKWVHMPRARSAAVAGEVACALAFRLPPGQRRVRLLARRSDWRNRLLDQRVARRMAEHRPGAFLGMQWSSLRSLRQARRVGAFAALYVITDDWGVRAALEKEAGLAPGARQRREIIGEMKSRMRHSQAEALAADLVLVQSERMLDQLCELGVDPGAIEILGNGVDLDAFHPVQRDAQDRPLRVVQVSRVGYAKGVHHACQAVQLAGPAVERFSVVGDDAAHAPALRGRYPMVDFAGPLLFAAMPPRYARSDVFMLPTLADSQARTVLEAMASGLPIITTREAGFEGIIRDGVEGFLVSAGDVEAMAACLRRLATDGELRLRMGDAARTRAENFSWERFEARFDQVLDERFKMAAH